MAAIALDQRGFNREVQHQANGVEGKVWYYAAPSDADFLFTVYRSVRTLNGVSAGAP